MAELVAGAAVGLLFSAFYDGIKIRLGTYVGQLRPLTRLMVTLECLRPLIIHQLEEYNEELDLPNEEMECLMQTLKEGLELVHKLSNLSRWSFYCKCFTCNSRSISDQIFDLDESLQIVLARLKFQCVRDVKEVMLQVRHIRESQDEMHRKMEDFFQFGSMEDEEQQRQDFNKTSGQAESDPISVGIVGAKLEVKVEGGPSTNIQSGRRRQSLFDLITQGNNDNDELPTLGSISGDDAFESQSKRRDVKVERGPSTNIPSGASEKPSTSDHLEPPSRIVCHICQKQFSQYTCPRCNSRYCSLHCYKSHNLRCTESFMRGNVVGELGQLGPDDETKQKMLDILKRFHSEEKEETDDMDDEDGCFLSEDTVQKVLSGGQISFDDPSAEEKKLFQRAVASGELSKTIEPNPV